VDIRVGSLENGHQTTEWVIEKMDFQGFRHYVFGTLENESNAISY